MVLMVATRCRVFLKSEVSAFWNFWNQKEKGFCSCVVWSIDLIWGLA